MVTIISKKIKGAAANKVQIGVASGISVDRWENLDEQGAWWTRERKSKSHIKKEGTGRARMKGEEKEERREEEKSALLCQQQSWSTPFPALYMIFYFSKCSRYNFRQMSLS